LSQKFRIKTFIFVNFIIILYTQPVWVYELLVAYLYIYNLHSVEP